MHSTVMGVVSDLDWSLVRLIGGKEQLFTIFVRHGVARSVVKECYKRSRENGFSFQRLLAILEDTGHRFGDRRALEKELEEWFSRSLVLYEDVRGFMNSVKKAGLRFAVITYGSPTHQRHKITKVRLAPDFTKVVRTEKARPRAVAEAVSRYGYPVIYIDDRASALDLVKEKLGDRVITARIVRTDSPYKDEKPKLRHEILHSLLEVKSLFGKQTRKRVAA